MYKFLSVSFVLLFWWAGCQNSPAKKAGAEESKLPDSISLNASSNFEASVNETIRFPTTFPKVWFVAIADSVLLRDTPQVKTQRWDNYASPFYTIWTGVETDYKETIPCLGKSKSFAWLQLIAYDSYTRWIYGGCVAPVIFDFSESIDSVTPSTKRWLILQKTDSLTFAKMRKMAQADTLRQTGPFSTIENDSLPIKITVKGQEKIIRDNLVSGEGFADYTLLKEEHGWYIIAGGFWEWADYRFIRKSDGFEYHTFGSGYKMIPLVSPNHHRWVFPSEQGYGDNFNNGIEIFDSKTCRSVGLQFPNDDSTVDAVWETSEIFHFKTHNGAYFKVEIKDLFD